MPGCLFCRQEVIKPILPSGCRDGRTLLNPGGPLHTLDIGFTGTKDWSPHALGLIVGHASPLQPLCHLCSEQHSQDLVSAPATLPLVMCPHAASSLSGPPGQPRTGLSAS